MLLSEVTTLRLGGPCEDVVVAVDEAELIEAITQADVLELPVLILAGGSNVVIADSGWPGRVVLVRTSGVTVAASGAETDSRFAKARLATGEVETGSSAASGPRVLVTAAAGETWDDFARTMVTQGFGGVEALVGIPGAVGSTPIQNVGAYGQEVADTVVSVRVWDRHTHQTVTLAATECGFAYRDSRFKREPGRFVVLAVTFALTATGDSAPVRYGELARHLNVEAGQRAPVAQVAQTVLNLRAGKGMVLDAADHDTWSAGSFFTNPILTSEDAHRLLPESAPRFAAGEAATADRTPQVKTSAAWLIEHAGFTKGFRVRPDAPVALSSKHTLALTNRGGATTADLLELARTVRDGVREHFGVTLVPEPVLVGCAL